MNDPRIDADLVRNLISDQFPHWARLPVTPMKTCGWDNCTFHLGDTMSVRLPSAQRYAAQVAKEQQWLPHLAPHLPFPIPVPLGEGQPSAAYPFAWSIMRWLPGETLETLCHDIPTNIAVDLANFLNALRNVPSAGGPSPGQHNFYRGGDLRIYDQEVRHCLSQLGTGVAHDAIMQVWTAACHSHWAEPPVWLHGDVAAGNLLISGNKLAAVIDFGSCGIGDPACDLTIAWTAFNRPARGIFREHIALDAGTWMRAAGWALWKELLNACKGDPTARQTITTILEDTAKA